MRQLIAFFLLILLTIFAIGVSFSTSVQINSGQTTFTNQPLVCTWGYSGDTTAQNISWYQDGSLVFNFYENSSLSTNSTIGSANTSRDEVWRCRVILFNGTHNVSSQQNVTIENQAPNTPTLYNNTGTDISESFNITEDVTFLLDMNSSDIDNDTLTYFFFTSSFCTVTSSSTGAVSCLADHDDVSNATETESTTTYQIEFSVRDTPPTTKSSSRLVNITVIPVNDDPIVTLSNQSINVSDTLNVTFTASDEEEYYPLNASLVTAQTSSNISDDLTISMEGNTTLRVVYETSPTEFEDVGNHTVTINLSDARNASAFFSFTLEVLQFNRNPTFVNFSPLNYSSTTSYTYALSQGDFISINITANDPDTTERNETITFSDNTSLFTTQTLSSTASNNTDARGQINFTATNSDVGNHTVLITIQDSVGDTNTTLIYFDISNVNDAPTIYNQSFDAENSGGNINITSLSGYLAAPFYYQINYTDPDETYGDTLTWSDNSTYFNVSSDGSINFTPSGMPNNETVNITVTDAQGLSDTKIILFELQNNTAPQFTSSFPSLNCSEGSLCTFDVSSYATDVDPGDSIDDYSYSVQNLSSFEINSTSGVINFTPSQSELGNYTIQLTITDTRGASVSQNLQLQINNTPDTPVWVTYDFSSLTIVEDRQFNFLLRASDNDLLINAISENITFSSNLSFISITYQSTSNITALAVLSFTPNASTVGNYTVQLNATDSTGRTNSTDVSFTVLADTDAPSIIFAKPYSLANGTRVDGFKNVSNYTTLEENISITENTTGIIFEANATDDVTALGSLTYYWFYDDVLFYNGTGNSANNVTRNFNFFSSGSHTIAVRVNDTTLENTTWTWNLDIEDVNRAPQFITNFSDNLTIDSTTTFPNFFRQFDGQHFYDADLDIDGNGSIDTTETFDLTITAAPSCSVATITQNGDDLQLTPESVGNCIVQFTAQDDTGAQVSSNLVTIFVTEVPTSSSSSSSSSSGGGGGGSSQRQTQFVPLETEVDNPKPLSIVTPQLVTIYKNRTIAVPIRLVNNWTTPLEGIILAASTNASDVVIQFSSNYIESLDIGESQDVMMTVGGYRLGENFEVTVTGNVTEPEFNDEALILFNSIEQAEDGESVSVKVTFANDLLSQNEECQELNEILLQADARLQAGDLAAASELVDSVINGCKYLISKTTPPLQRPSFLRSPFINLPENLRAISYIFLGAIVIASLAGLLYYHFKTKDQYDY